MNYERGASTSTSAVQVGDEATSQENSPSDDQSAVESTASDDDSDSFEFEQTEDINAHLIRRFSKEF